MAEIARILVATLPLLSRGLIVFLNDPKNGHSADTSKSPAGESQAGLCISY
ncbi:hypothetical protein MPC4_170098 [Methylocella tundrae]|uniref:Uncharacterized protein n=1 Tax=Methylocella tundrae TaxID=227605 RepID=A0A8B6M3E4_METTU|nr:hypothetical protein MPC1_2740002 [Methylocella tundrae]VTZ49567.1 hypothetical protein MPC4_170098 [Methylocella tundrae]